MAEIAPVEAAGMIDADRACMHCGYNLRGLATNGRCPECGDLIDQSMRGDLLRYANPDWLRRVRLGHILLYYAVTLIAGLWFFGGMPMPLSGILLYCVIDPVGFIGGSITLLALFISTTQEPRIALTEGPLTWRRIIRAFAGGVLVTAIILQTPFLDALIGPLARACVHLGMGLGVLVIAYGYFVYLVTLASRIPDSELVDSTRTARFYVTLAHTTAVLLLSAMAIYSAIKTTNPTALGTVLPTVGRRARMPFGSPILGCVQPLMGLVMFIYGLRAMRVLLQYRRALKLAVLLSSRGDQNKEEISGGSTTNQPA